MKIEIHIIHNLPPHCLNRDDTNTAKTCDFGAHRRARVSSQCWKRAVRQEFAKRSVLKPEDLSVRTRRLAQEVAAHLVRLGHDAEEADVVAHQAIEGVGLGFNTEHPNLTQYLLFVPATTGTKIASLLHEQWGAVTSGTESPKKAKGKATAKEAKAEAKASYSKEVGKALRAILDETRTVDLALFGRMIADQKAMDNVSASCQVAHAVSTHKVNQELDFFSAVDDLSPADEAGAGMVGSASFNSACFYRYCVLDVNGLRSNLGNPPDDFLRLAIREYLLAFFTALPSARQNSTAAHTPPSYILGGVRPYGNSLSLANAFAKPCVPTASKDLVEVSICALEEKLLRTDPIFRGEATYISWSEDHMDEHSLIQRAHDITALVDNILQLVVP